MDNFWRLDPRVNDNRTANKAIAALLDDLTTAAFRHPKTGMRLIYELA